MGGYSYFTSDGTIAYILKSLVWKVHFWLRWENTGKKYYCIIYLGWIKGDAAFLWNGEMADLGSISWMVFAEQVIEIAISIFANRRRLTFFASNLCEKLWWKGETAKIAYEKLTPGGVMGQVKGVILGVGGLWLWCTVRGIWGGECLEWK